MRCAAIAGQHGDGRFAGLQLLVGGDGLEPPTLSV
jgi:hypothetical protein